MILEEIRETPIWTLYEKGRNYHRRTDIYTDTDRNYRMYNGDQWAGAKLGGIEPVQKNFIKPIVKYKLSVIHDNLYAIVFSSQNHKPSFRKSAKRYCDMLNGYAERVWEKDKMDKKGRSLTKDSAIVGEGILYIDFDKETMMPVNEVINMADVYYGNENDDDIEKQPYILIRKRLAQSVAIDLALSLGMSEDKKDFIKGDTDTFEEAGESAKEELDNNVTIVYKLYKKDKRVHFSAASRWVTICEDVDLGISLYPIAHFNWEEKKGSARGEGEVKNLIPNQIEVNRTAMRRVLTVKEQAYPMKVVDVSKVANPDALNTVGGVIRTLGGAPVDDVHKIVGTIPPAQMSSDVVQLEEDLINVSRDLAGAGDTATGEVDPESASGRAILAVQQAQRAPVTEQKEGYKDTIEDIAKIWLEYLIVHAVEGIELEEKVNDPKTGEEVIVMTKVPQSVLKELQATVKIDITPKSHYDRFAQEQTIENLFVQGLLSAERVSELEVYGELLDDDSVAPKQKILEAVELIKDKQKQIAMIQAEAQIMQQRAQQFLMGDPDEQAEQISDAQMQLEAQVAAQEQGYADEEAELDEEVAAEEEATEEE